MNTCSVGRGLLPRCCCMSRRRLQLEPRLPELAEMLAGQERGKVYYQRFTDAADMKALLRTTWWYATSDGLLPHPAVAAPRRGGVGRAGALPADVDPAGCDREQDVKVAGGLECHG